MKILMSMSGTTLFLWLFLVVAMSCIINLGCCSNGQINGGMNCRENERDALLKIKNGLKDPSHRLASWSVDAADHAADCCNWYGVMCDNTTGHVLELQLRGFSDHEEWSSFGGKIRHSLLNLTHLRYLDLSNNVFEGIQIPKFLGSMESLRYLNLSQSGFGGHIPPQLGNLTSLLYLNLKSSYSSSSSSKDVHWLSDLSSLQFLDMSGVNLSKSLNWMNVINTLPSLQELHLSYCNLPSPPLIRNLNISSLSVLDLTGNGVSESIVSWISHFKHLKSLYLAYSFSYSSNIPREFLNMSTTLRELDLSDNDFNSSIPIWLYDFSNIEYLNLATNEFQGQISDAIQNMTSLVTLDLSYNEQLLGGIPASFRNLCNLRILILRSVNLSQQVSQFFENLLGCGSNGLESLHLDNCQLSGSIPMSLVELESLRFLSLSNNKLSGDLPTNLENLKKLEELDIQGNSISGSVPISLGQLRTLMVIYFSSNKLRGDVSETHFANLSSLVIFNADGNKLNLKVGANWIPPPQLERLHLGSWNVGPQFPTWLSSLKNLVSLNLSNCGISTSSIPGWFWSLSSQLDTLSLSHNNIQGMLPNKLTFPSLSDLSSNNFQGPLPHHDGGFLTVLDLSNNSFSGSISNFLCRSTTDSLTYLLNLENNILDGEIPNCWNRWGNLEMFRLSNNKFNGSIPESIGNLSTLKYLHLHNNNLSSEVPFSLGDCTELVTLDIAGNKLEGNIPGWIGEKLLNLVILNLGTNSFSGKIPKKICHVTSLHILDFSNNNLFGTIPRCLSNFSAMTNINEFTGVISGRYYHVFDTMQILMKGEMYEYGSILGFVKIVDLSSNRLSGEILEEITHLKGLQSLNLSHNSLSGRIPKNIGSMTLIESVDFSSNQLVGEIPPSISKLTFLSRLNLSHNELVGRIPSSTQIQSLDSSCFIGNELCGKPLTDNCSGDGIVSPPSSKENGNNHDFQIE